MTIKAATVGVSYFDLSPNPVEIKTGEAVHWTETDPDFGPYIISGPWGNLATPAGIQFNSAGTYSYSASSAFGGGSWGGTVIVRPNSPPVVTITSPTNHSVFTAPATIAFEADAFDANPDDLWDVEFWVGGQMTDDVYSAPYVTTITNLAAGNYVLKAVAWDYSYAKATNTITITVVNSGPISLQVDGLTEGNFRFNASGLTAGKALVLQSTANVASPSSWVSLSTNVVGSSNASFTNTVFAGQHFFRVLQLP